MGIEKGCPEKFSRSLDGAVKAIRKIDSKPKDSMPSALDCRKKTATAGKRRRYNQIAWRGGNPPGTVTKGWFVTRAIITSLNLVRAWSCRRFFYAERTT